MLEMPDLRRRASKKDSIMNTQSGQKTISFQAAINHALCCILSLVLVVGFCPVSALADDQTGKNILDSLLYPKTIRLMKSLLVRKEKHKTIRL